MTPARKPANYALNYIRAIAALVVCLGHVRGYLLIPRGTADWGFLNNAAYALTSLGNGAVLVFFVLSGYFVGGNVLRGRLGTAWSWSYYLWSRGIRLWAVLVPALVLTLVLDNVGLNLFDGAERYGQASEAATNGSPSIFLGNLFFLQSHFFRTFGSNDALWTLSYEAFYYIAFPILLMGILGKKVSYPGRTAAGVALIGLVVLAGPSAVALGAVWLVGVGSAFLRPYAMRWNKRMSKGAVLVTRLLLLGSTGAGMILDRVEGGNREDLNMGTLLTALSAGLLILVFESPQFYACQNNESRKWHNMLVRGSSLADSSYSLYAIHLPLLTFISAVFVPVGSAAVFQPDTRGWLLVVLVGLALVLSGWGFSLATERQYTRLLGWVTRSTTSRL